MGLGVHSEETLSKSPRVAITIDDPNLSQSLLLAPKERNRKILETLERHNLKAALFVCGSKVDTPAGHQILKQWHEAGHLMGNHTYSHKYFNSPKMSGNDLTEDVLRNEKMLGDLIGNPKLLRFPFLKEGETIEKRDAMRAFLSEHGYRNGHVTVDASDWYIDGRMCEQIKKEPDADLTPYRDYYLV